MWAGSNEPVVAGGDGRGDPIQHTFHVHVEGGAALPAADSADHQMARTLGRLPYAAFLSNIDDCGANLFAVKVDSSPSFRQPLDLVLILWRRDIGDQHLVAVTQRDHSFRAHHPIGAVEHHSVPNRRGFHPGWNNWGECGRFGSAQFCSDVVRDGEDLAVRVVHVAGAAADEEATVAIASLGRWRAAKQQRGDLLYSAGEVNPVPWSVGHWDSIRIQWRAEAGDRNTNRSRVGKLAAHELCQMGTQLSRAGARLCGPVRARRDIVCGDAVKHAHARQADAA